MCEETLNVAPRHAVLAKFRLLTKLSKDGRYKHKFSHFHRLGEQLLMLLSSNPPQILEDVYVVGFI